MWTFTFTVIPRAEENITYFHSYLNVQKTFRFLIFCNMFLYSSLLPFTILQGKQLYVQGIKIKTH